MSSSQNRNTSDQAPPNANPYQYQQQHNYASSMRPISSKKIENTDWLEVNTNVGIKYWYNEKTQENTWEKPKEVIDALRNAASRNLQPPPPLDPLKKKMLERAIASGAVIAPQYDVSRALTYTAKDNDSNKGGDEDEFDVTFTEDDIIDDNTGSDGNDNRNTHTTTNTKQQQDDTRVVKNPEDEFKNLLQQIGVHGFSRYEKELPKMKDDDRFKAIANDQQRRRIFEAYCSTLGQPGGKSTVVEKEGKNSGGGVGGYTKTTTTTTNTTTNITTNKAADNAFKALLQEKITESTTTWNDIIHNTHLTKDDRWTSIDDDTRKKVLFQSHMNSLKRMEEARRKAEKRAYDVAHASEQRQRQAGRADAISNCQALIAEVVRDSSVVWDDAWIRLKVDPQRRATHELLDKETVRRLFIDRIEYLRKREEDEDGEESGEEEGEEEGVAAKRAKLDHDDE